MIAPLSGETFERTEPAPPAALGRLRASLPQPFQSRLRSARELSRARHEEDEERPPLKTAVPVLDRLLEGGLPRGCLVELVGGRSSGRFSAALSVLAAATGVGEAAALVDLGDGLDPAMAETMGVDLRRLLWIRPAQLKQALASAEMALGAGFPLVVIDLGQPPIRGGRGVEAAWLRLARSARSHGSALLVSSPYRVSGTAASVVLKTNRPRAVWRGGEGSPWLLGGFSAQIEIEKVRGRLPGRAEEVELSMAESPLPAKPAASPKPRLRIERAEPLPSVWDVPLHAAAGRR